MELDVLKHFFCPKCKSSINISPNIIFEDGEVLEGILSCACDSFPVVSGIMLFHHPKKKLLLELLKNPHTERDLLEPLLESKTDLLMFETDYERLLYLGFNKIHADSLRLKFSSKSFFEIIPFFSVIKGNLILDAACGSGYYSNLIRKYLPEKKLLSLDKSFLSLFLARKLFGLKNLVCANICMDMPFNNEFDTIICSDAFHYFPDKSVAANNLKSSLLNNGVLLLLHLHNYLQKNYYAGTPLSVKGYEELFPGSKLFPNSQVIHNYFISDALDLSKNYSFDLLDKDQTFSLVYSNDLQVFSKKVNISKLFFRKSGKYFTNPIYTINRLNNSMHLDLKYPSVIFEKEHSIPEKYFPKKILIKDSDLQKDSFLKDLQRKFIIIG